MFTRQVAVISNQATWRSFVYEVVDEEDDTTTDLTDPALDVDIVVTIRERDDCCTPRALVTASIDNGKVIVPGPGFYWQFEDSDLSSLCVGTYTLGAKITIDDYVQDIIIGSLAVIQGN